MNEFERLRKIWEYDRIVSQLPPVTLAAFVKHPIPRRWYKWPIGRRQRWWKGIDVPQSAITRGLIRRDRICAIEVWCEFYGQTRKSYRQTYARAINQKLAKIPGLERVNVNIRCGPYGFQRGFYVHWPDEESTDNVND